LRDACPQKTLSSLDDSSIGGTIRYQPKKSQRSGAVELHSAYLIAPAFRSKHFLQLFADGWTSIPTKSDWHWLNDVVGDVVDDWNAGPLGGVRIKGVSTRCGIAGRAAPLSHSTWIDPSFAPCTGNKCARTTAVAAGAGAAIARETASVSIGAAGGCIIEEPARGDHWPLAAQLDRSDALRRGARKGRERKR